MVYCFTGGCCNPAVCDYEEHPSLDRDPASMNTGHNNKLWHSWRFWIRDKKGCMWRDIVAMGRDRIVMGCGKIRWRHLSLKLRAELKKLIATRPSQGFNYDAQSYALNFDDG